MKFAVKTVTCLGCKTPLKTNKGMFKSFAQSKTDLPTAPFGRWCCVSELSAQVGRIVPEARKYRPAADTLINKLTDLYIVRFDRLVTSRFCPALDSMPALSRVFASGQWDIPKKPDRH